MNNKGEFDARSQIFLFAGKTKKKMKALARLYLEKNDLSLSEIELIMFINLSGRNTSKDYVDYSGLSRSLVSKIVDSLVKKGFLEQVQDPTDRRVFHLNLKKKAGNFIEANNELKKMLMDCALEGISDEDIEIMEKNMEKIYNNIDRAINEITGGKQE